jgi:hypothetical protein
MAKRGKGKKKGGKGKKGIGGSSGAIQAIPRKDVSVLVRKQTARWEITGGDQSNAIIYIDYLITCLLTLAVSTTVVWSVFFAIRIRKITFYTPAGNSAVLNNVVFEWVTPSGNTRSVQPSSYTGGTVGTASGERLSFKPPKNSNWSSWLSFTNPAHSALCMYSCPNHTTIDIEYDAIADNLDSSATVTGLTGLTIGSNYRLGIDITPKATSQYTVLGFRNG